MTRISSLPAAGVALSKPTYRLLNAWFCPYGHRATLAFEHHASRIDYLWIEALGWKQQESTIAKPTTVPTTTSTTTTTTTTPTSSTTGSSISGSSTTDKNTSASSTMIEKEWIYHWKAEELKRVNPSALVPTILPIDSQSKHVDETKAIYESLVTVEYIDQVVKKLIETTIPISSSNQLLLPYDDPYWFAQCRIWAEKVNRECCSPYYGVLVRHDPMERKQHFDALLQGLQNFSKQLEQTSGSLFLPNQQLSIVDIALIPWAYRYYVLSHYRGDEYSIPKTPALQKYWEWWDCVRQLDHVQCTFPDPDQYLQHIAKYADGTARSKVANAVRRGVAAHEMDDAKD